MVTRKPKDPKQTTVNVFHANRPRKPWLETITPTGAVIVVVAGVVTLCFGITTCILYLQGNLATAKDCALQTAGVMAILVALASRTRPDPAATVDQPADVTASNQDEAGD